MIPIFALTADVTDDVAERVENAGMQGYISKPIDSAVLYSTLARAFENRQMPAARQRQIGSAAGDDAAGKSEK